MNGAGRLGAALVAVLAGASLTAGCAHVRLTADSPRMTGYTIASSSAGSETSQRVVVTVRFDRPVTVGSGALHDLDLRIDGARPDGHTTTTAVRQAGPDALAVEIAAAPGRPDRPAAPTSPCTTAACRSLPPAAAPASLT